MQELIIQGCATDRHNRAWCYIEKGEISSQSVLQEGEQKRKDDRVAFIWDVWTPCELSNEDEKQGCFHGQQIRNWNFSTPKHEPEANVKFNQYRLSRHYCVVATGNNQHSVRYCFYLVKSAFVDEKYANAINVNSSELIPILLLGFCELPYRKTFCSLHYF